jgi:hypothetical protein
MSSASAIQLPLLLFFKDYIPYCPFKELWWSYIQPIATFQHKEFYSQIALMYFIWHENKVTSLNSIYRMHYNGNSVLCAVGTEFYIWCWIVQVFKGYSDIGVSTPLRLPISIPPPSWNRYNDDHCNYSSPLQCFTDENGRCADTGTTRNTAKISTKSITS